MYDASAGLHRKVLVNDLGGGTVQGGTNLGAGAQVFSSLNGVNLEFRSVIGGEGLAQTQNANDVTVDLDINGLTTENTLDVANDQIAFYDASATAHRKTAIENLRHTNSSGATPHANPTTGDTWYDTDEDILYERVNDGTTDLWIDVSTDGNKSPVHTAASTPPAGATEGDYWYDIDDDILYKRINDGTSDIWIDVSSDGILQTQIATYDASYSAAGTARRAWTTIGTYTVGANDAGVYILSVWAEINENNRDVALRFLVDGTEIAATTGGDYANNASIGGRSPSGFSAVSDALTAGQVVTFQYMHNASTATADATGGFSAVRA